MGGKITAKSSLKGKHKEKFCLICRKEITDAHYRKTCSKECSKELEKRRILIWTRKQGKKYRLEVFKILGNRCSNPNCLILGKCVDERCLQIDHINGGGRQERNGLIYYQYYKSVLHKIKRGSKNYQLLCANCNIIKEHDLGKNSCLSKNK